MPEEKCVFRNDEEENKHKSTSGITRGKNRYFFPTEEMGTTADVSIIRGWGSRGDFGLIICIFPFKGESRNNGFCEW